MLKKLLLAVLACIAFTGPAFADVDINKADQAGLDGIKGIGPKMSQKILDERKRGGDFKDWNDVQARMKGIKEKSALKLSTAGLTVNGQSKNGAPPATSTSPKLASAKAIGTKHESASTTTAADKAAPLRRERAAASK